MNIYLRDQATILADAKARLRDPSNARWQDEDIYRAIGDALSTWHGRVSIPLLHNVTGGWTGGIYEYTIPAYINAATIIPQFQRTVPYVYWGNIAVDETLTWVDIPGWSIEPADDGTWTLRFDVAPYATAGRLLWYGINGPLPVIVPTTSGETLAAATSMVLGSVVDCVDHGYVKVGNEWMQYSGVTRAAATTTLLNLVRGHAGGVVATTAATASNCYFGVAMPRLELYRVLLDQTFVYLHELYLTDAASKEKQTHQQMIGFYQGRIDKFWRAWTGARRPRLILDRRFALVG